MPPIPPPSKSFWTSWWDGIVEESNKRCENVKPETVISAAPPDLGSSFFSEQLARIDEEARRRLEIENAERTAKEISAPKPPKLENPISDAPSLFSFTPLKEFYEEANREAERRLETDNQGASFFDIGTDLFTSLGGAIEKIAGKAKEAFSCPAVIGGTNYNYCSNFIQTESEQRQKTMAGKVEEIRKSGLSLEELDIINGEFVEEASFIAQSPEIDLPESSESKSGKEKIEDEVLAFCKSLIFYLTFYLLHEIIAGQKATPEEQREPLYQMMTKLAIDASIKPDPLWDIYYEYLGKKLSGFAFFKVRLFYLLFYSLTDFIPTLIKESSKHGATTFYELLTDEKKLDLHISTALARTENYLTRLNSSIADFGKTNGDDGNLDFYKKRVVHKLFGEDLNQKLSELIKRASRKAVDRFFPEIVFCELGKASSSDSVRWAGKKISICVNYALQNLLIFFLKTIVIPTALQTILKKWLSEDPDDVYLLRYKLQKAILDHIRKMNQTLDQPKIKKETSDVEVSNSDKLETIASGLTKILSIPSDESPEVVRAHLESQSLERQGMNRALKKGILKAGHGIIKTLHEPTLFEDSLIKMLDSSKKTLCGDMERSHPKTFSSLKSDYNRDKRELRKETDKLALALTDETIDDALGSDLEAFDQRTGGIQAKIQYKTEWLAASLTILMSQIEAALKNPENSFDDELDSTFWTHIQEFVQEMDVQGLAKQHPKALPTALKEGLDEALQPLRKKTEQIIDLADSFDKVHKDYHLYSTVGRELGYSLDHLRTIRDHMEDSGFLFEDAFSAIPKCTAKVFRLLQKLPNFISQREQEEIKNKEGLLRERLKSIDHEEMIISELNFLIGDSGPVYQLILFMQRQSLSPFNSEKARNTIREIFAKTNLPKDLMKLIDVMLRFTSRSEDSNWNNLKSIILEQLPRNSPLEEKFQEAFDQWQHLARGKALFDPKIWEKEKRSFLQKLQREELSRQLAASLLDQIEGFLRENSILNARWNQFCEKIEQERNPHILKSRENKKLYENEAIQFYEMISFHLNIAESRKNSLLSDLMNQIPRIQSNLNALKIAAKSWRIKMPFSSEVTLTSAGTLFGGATFSLTTILGAPLWLAVGIGAAAGGLLGRNIRSIGRAYSKKRIIPNVHELLAKAQNEGLQLHTRQVIAFSILDAFGE